jgi:hypothetical protein
MKLNFSLLDETQNNITENDYQKLVNKVEEQYVIVEKLYWFYQETLDFDFYDMYIVQLDLFAKKIQRIRAINPQIIRMKCQEILAEADKLWAENTLQWVEKTGADGSKVLEQNLTHEIVTRYILLLDTAQTLGWEPPTSKLPLPPEKTNVKTDPVILIAEETARRTRDLLNSRGWCLWRCAALDNDVIAVVRDELVEGVPHGYPVYTEDELTEICGDGTSETTIKLIHEAKKLTGAMVTDMTMTSKK